jgi:hypothetical protein
MLGAEAKHTPSLRLPRHNVKDYLQHIHATPVMSGPARVAIFVPTTAAYAPGRSSKFRANYFDPQVFLIAAVVILSSMTNLLPTSQVEQYVYLRTDLTDDEWCVIMHGNA